MTIPGKGGAPFGPRAPNVIRGLELVRQALAEGRPVYDRKAGRGIYSDAAREVGITPQQMREAWLKYGEQ